MACPPSGGPAGRRLRRCERQAEQGQGERAGTVVEHLHGNKKPPLYRGSIANAIGGAASSSHSRKLELSYFDVCTKFTWDPFANNDEKFEKLVAINELLRRKMSSKEQKNIKNKGFCIAATYKYERTTKWADQTNASRELDSFTVQQNVSAMSAEQRGERLKRFFSTLSTDMIAKLDPKLGDLGKTKKETQKGKKVLRL